MAQSGDPVAPVDGADSLTDRLLVAHDALLWLAGRVPDAMLAQGRAWLADGRLFDVASAVTYQLHTRPTAVPRFVADVLADMFLAEERDPSPVLRLPVAEWDPAPHFLFRPRLSADADETVQDETDRAIADAAQVDGDVRGVWRVWRVPLDDAPWPPPKRVFLVEASTQRGLPTLAARLQSALEAVGERDPQVEVFHTGLQLYAYHRQALGEAHLTWMPPPTLEIRVALVFDEVGPGDDQEDASAWFHPDHPKLDLATATRVADYLDAGTVLLSSFSLAEDILDTSRGSVVPLNFRTDGSWIWCDAMTYYLREHGLAPDPELLAHIEAVEYAVREPDVTAVQRALAALQDSAEQD